MSPYPFTALPCQICTTHACTNPSPGHGLPVMIALAHASRADKATGCGLFCGEDSPFNTFYLLHDAAAKFSRAEAILHTAGMAVGNVAAFLAGSPHESATGPAAIRQILLKVDRPDFVASTSRGRRVAGPYRLVALGCCALSTMLLRGLGSVASTGLRSSSCCRIGRRGRRLVRSRRRGRLTSKFLHPFIGIETLGESFLLTLSV